MKYRRMRFGDCLGMLATKFRRTSKFTDQRPPRDPAALLSVSISNSESTLIENVQLLGRAKDLHVLERAHDLDIYAAQAGLLPDSRLDEIKAALERVQPVASRARKHGARRRAARFQSSAPEPGKQ
jgi:hypothetical protein